MFDYVQTVSLSSMWSVSRTARAPVPQIYGSWPRSISANLLAGLADLARAGLAGQMEADVWLERAMALARMYASLGMRLCALELCSVY